MSERRAEVTKAALAIALLFVGFAVGRGTAPETLAATVPVGVAEAIAVSAGAEDRVFELRTYTAAEGKYDALLARFRDHTMALFEKHGMTNVGYWTPQDEPLSTNTLVYVLAHDSREAAEANWSAFSADPEWQSVFQASRADGPLIAGLERVYLDATDFSPMK